MSASIITPISPNNSIIIIIMSIFSIISIIAN
jgi:hypothetical protein